MFIVLSKEMKAEIIIETIKKVFFKSPGVIEEGWKAIEQTEFQYTPTGKIPRAKEILVHNYTLYPLEKSNYEEIKNVFIFKSLHLGNTYKEIEFGVQDCVGNRNFESRYIMDIARGTGFESFLEKLYAELEKVYG